MLTKDELDKLFDCIGEIADKLEYQDYHEFEGHTFKLIEEGTDNHRSSWTNWIVFKIDDEERLFKTEQDANSWDSSGWELPYEVVTKDVTYTEYQRKI